jgi:hypothetical protein
MKSIAEKKRQQNIAEYIIYMYQMEDLIRAYNFVLADIEQYVVSHYPVDASEKSDTLDWFGLLAHQMQTEGIEAYGHLTSLRVLVDTLAKLHWSLLKTDSAYFHRYQQAKPYILQLMLEDGATLISHEVQLFFNAVYGRLLARLHGREIPSSVLEATEAFGDILSYLSAVYHNQ